MTFFYDLNKKLDTIRAKPETTHQQLNERDMSRAAKGYEKYGKQGMEALAKAGREGKALEPIRAKYDKYDNKKDVEEGMGDMVKKAGGMAKKVGGAVLNKLGHGDDADMIRDLQRKMGVPQTGMKPGSEPNPKQVKEVSAPIDYDKVLDAIAALYGPDIWDNDAMQFLANDLEQAGPTDRELDFIIAKGKLPKRLAGIKFTAGDDVQFGEGASHMSAKQKSFAALAEPKDKITFADKIAGAKKEVDEVLGDVAAEAMKKAISGHGTTKAEPKKEGWDDMMKDVERRRSEVKPGHKVAGAKGDIEKTATGIRHTRRYDAKTGETDTGDDAPADGEKRGRGRPKGSKAAIGAKGPSGKSKLMTKEADQDSMSDEIKQAMAVLKKAGYKVEKDQKELGEKAVSKNQAVAARIARGVQKGKAEAKPGSASAEMAKMKPKELKKFAKTDTKDLPKKVKAKEEVEETTAETTPKAKGGLQFGKGIYDSMNHELEKMIAESMNISMSMNTDAQGGPGKTITVTATDQDAETLAKMLQQAGLGGDQHMEEAYGDVTATENQPEYPTNTETSNDPFQYSGGINKPKSTGQTTVPVIAGQENRMMAYEEQDDLARMMEMAGQPASGMGAQVGDMIDYVNPTGEQPSEELTLQNGVVYDPDTNIISVKNATSLAATHREIEAAGWKKKTAGARRAAAPGQAQVAGDTPYQLGEEDDLARMMEMAGVKKKEVEEEKTEEGNKFTGNLAKARAAGKSEADLDGDGDTEKVRESIFSLTNQWQQYKV